MNDETITGTAGSADSFRGRSFWTSEAWFAVHSHLRQEEMAACTLQTLGLKILLPKVRCEQVRRQVRSETVKPLFSGYFFARFSPRAHLHSVRYSRGVHSVVSAGSTPVPIDEPVIAEIEERLDSQGVAELQRSRFEPGQHVTVSSGPLEGISGVFERALDDGGRVTVLLNLMEHARLTLEARLLEPAAF